MVDAYSFIYHIHYQDFKYSKLCGFERLMLCFTNLLVTWFVFFLHEKIVEILLLSHIICTKNILPHVLHGKKICMVS